MNMMPLDGNFIAVMATIFVSVVVVCMTAIKIAKILASRSVASPQTVRFAPGVTPFKGHEDESESEITLDNSTIIAALHAKRFEESGEHFSGTMSHKEEVVENNGIDESLDAMRGMKSP